MEYELFMKTVDELVNSIDAEINKVNPFYLMSCLNQMFIHSINDPINSRSKLPDGFLQKFHYVSGILVSKQLTTTLEIESRNSDEISVILELTEARSRNQLISSHLQQNNSSLSSAISKVISKIGWTLIYPPTYCMLKQYYVLY